MQNQITRVILFVLKYKWVSNSIFRAIFVFVYGSLLYIVFPPFFCSCILIMTLEKRMIKKVIIKSAILGATLGVNTI